MDKVGILGGTFDPVHYGHLSLAEQARDEAGLSKVFFMPASLQPFKLNQKVAAAEDRVEMLRLAVEGEKGFCVSQLELSLAGVSYTVNTLRAVRQELPPKTEVCFIIGTDAFLKINIWKEAEELLRNYTYLVGTRPGYREDELQTCIEYNRQVYNTKVERIHNRQLLLSSTEIKDKISRGESLKDLVPVAVEGYIYEKGLYQ